MLAFSIDTVASTRSQRRVFLLIILGLLYCLVSAYGAYLIINSESINTTSFARERLSAEDIYIKALLLLVMALLTGLEMSIMLILIIILRGTRVCKLLPKFGTIVDCLYRLETGKVRHALIISNYKSIIGIVFILIGVSLCFISLLATYTSFRGVLNKNVSQQIALCLFVFTIGLLIFRYSRRFFTAKAVSILTNDGRAAGLYLRSFEGEEILRSGISKIVGIYSYVFFASIKPFLILAKTLSPITKTTLRSAQGGSKSGWLRRLSDRIYRKKTHYGFDTALAIHFRRQFPMAAIGSPQERIPRSGIFRLFPPGDTWQQVVVKLIRSAPFIACTLGTSDGVRWEIGKIEEGCFLDKTVFLFPECNPFDWRWRNNDYMELIQVLTLCSGPLINGVFRELDERHLISICAFSDRIIITRSTFPPDRYNLLVAISVMQYLMIASVDSAGKSK